MTRRLGDILEQAIAVGLMVVVVLWTVVFLVPGAVVHDKIRDWRIRRRQEGEKT